jgi:hypothetical protein
MGVAIDDHVRFAPAQAAPGMTVQRGRVESVPARAGIQGPWGLCTSCARLVSGTWNQARWPHVMHT